MKFELSQIEMSSRDIKRGIKLPNYLTKELAEFIGIMVGDGHLHLSVGKQKNGSKLIR